MNNQPKIDVPPLSLHFIEAIDSLANIAKATGTYSTFVNALLTVAAIILGELNDPEQAQGTLTMLNQRQQQYREQNLARAAAAAPTNDVTETITGDSNVQH